MAIPHADALLTLEKIFLNNPGRFYNLRILSLGSSHVRLSVLNSLSDKGLGCGILSKLSVADIRPIIEILCMGDAMLF